jgi:intracellular multiplication protein IcmD
MKKMILWSLGLASLAVGTAAFAVSGLGGMATTATQSLGPIARLITAASYVAGLAFAVGAVVKFKTHKDNPTQVPIGTPIAMLFVGAALIFIPSVFKAVGTTMFGASGVASTPSGITTIDSKK